MRVDDTHIHPSRLSSRIHISCRLRPWHAPPTIVTWTTELIWHGVGGGGGGSNKHLAEGHSHGCPMGRLTDELFSLEGVIGYLTVRVSLSKLNHSRTVLQTQLTHELTLTD